MKKYIIITFLGIILPSQAYAFVPLQVNQGGTGANTLTGCLQGNGTSSITGTGIACGGGGSGSGTISTSSPAVNGNILYFSSPSTVANVATSTLTPSSPLGGSFTVIGSGGSLTCPSCSTFSYPFPSAATTTYLSLSGGLATTYASTTGISGNYASSTLYYGANLGSCNGASNALTWSGGDFGCNSGFITGNQSITLTGDITGSGATAITTTLKSTGLGAGTCTDCSLTVDAQGRVTVYGNVATTTFSSPLTYTQSTNAVTCSTCNTSSASVSSVGTTWPIVGGTITTSGTITFGGLSTTSAAVNGNIPYFSGPNTFANVATTSETCSSPLSCTAHTVLTGGGAISIQAAGASQNGYLSQGDYALIHAATTTFSGPLSYTQSTNAVTCPACATFAYPFAPSTDNALTTTATSTPLEDSASGPAFDVSQYGSYGQNGLMLAYASSTNGDAIFGTQNDAIATTSNASQSNTEVGQQIMQRITSATNNAAFGYQALFKDTSGSQDLAIGTKALTDITTGGNNVAIGYEADFTDATAYFNIGIGSQALFSETSAGNIGIGQFAGEGNVGVGNTFIGYQAASSTNTCSYCILLGYNVAPIQTNSANVLNIGTLLYGAGLTAQGTSTPAGTFGIATTTPWGVLSVVPTTAGAPLFVAATSTTILSTTPVFEITATGNVMTGGPTPTASVGIGSVQGDNKNFRFITNSAVSSTTITFSTIDPWVNTNGTAITPVCIATEESGGDILVSASSTPTTVQFNTPVSLSSRSIAVHCEASNNFTY